MNARPPAPPTVYTLAEVATLRAQADIEMQGLYVARTKRDIEYAAGGLEEIAKQLRERAARL